MRMLSQPLSDHELETLSAFLAERCESDRGMPLSMADGFMTAIVSGPKLIPPSVWLREVCTIDGPPKAKARTGAHFNDATELIFRRFNQISQALENKTADLLLARSDEVESDRDLCFGELWCVGYMRGIGLDAKGWEPLFADENAPDDVDDLFLLSVPAVAKKNGEVQPGMAEAYADYQALTLEERSEIAKNLPGPVFGIYEYWRDARRPAVIPPPATAQKIGRNEPCPCGSGKKSKRCCAA